MVLACVENKIYLYNTEDGVSIEFYDCIDHNNLLYCRRPAEPISLQRDKDVRSCHSNGRMHSFVDVLSANINVSTILHQWKSSIEKVDQYSYYKKSSTKFDGYLCECTNVQSFGKNCEYLLPFGETFDETISWQMTMRNANPSEVQRHGDVICYKTLECDYGLLCLDWRDICDGVQQCMFGLDEENCDRMELNECEDDEYRCMNGMCIPNEYFLDGHYDCLDWSDEIQYYDDKNCALGEASAQCDDRICLANQWSCGDGQCIIDRFAFQNPSKETASCENRRDSYEMCETHRPDPWWTLPNGRCINADKYEEVIVENGTTDEQCRYLVKCDISLGAEKQCPCGRNHSCIDLLNETCVDDPIWYPNGGIVAPYVLYAFKRRRELDEDWLDYVQINGTIKCRGFSIEIKLNDLLMYTSNLRAIEYVLCQWTDQGNRIETDGYDKDCYEHAKRLKNSSYSLIEVCPQSGECLSMSRFSDGIGNCADGMDEIDDDRVLDVCSRIRRYRFHCSREEATCLSVVVLGNGHSNCFNKFDELWLGTNLRISQMDCHNQSQTECGILRQYIETSWTSRYQNESNSFLRIRFDEHCDTFWNLGLKQNEDPIECRTWWMCRYDQWQCRTGQCIDPSWVLDGDWDCSDASDEESIFDQTISPRNLKIIELSRLKEKFEYHHGVQPLMNICDLRTEMACFHVDVKYSTETLTLTRPCLNRSLIGDGYVHCSGGIDERNRIEHCDRSTMLGYHFKCLSDNICIPYSKLCEDRCPNRSDDQFWCDRPSHTLECSHYRSFRCFDGSCIRYGRCNKQLDCSFGEDEYLCDYPSQIIYRHISLREEKEFILKKSKRNIDLWPFPRDANVTSLNISSERFVSKKSISASDSSVVYLCNRGVGMTMFNGSIVCFCPPQYFGERCEYHADRLSVLFHVNVSQSISSRQNVEMKMLILFVFEKTIISIDEITFREEDQLKKKLIHFVYSRSSEFVEKKRKRYRNRSSVLNEHPYSIQMELYQIGKDIFPIGLWIYPILFDHLPVYRLSKVLRLKEEEEMNPCSLNPCKENEQCWRIINENWKWICLCKSNLTGEDEECHQGFCFGNSFCRSNRRRIHSGSDVPYCICPLNYFGVHCSLLNERCRSNPCENGGRCISSIKPAEMICLCSEQYFGERCQMKKSEMKLIVSEMVEHKGAIVQYCEIDFVSLQLLVVHQQSYENLPQSLVYHHEGKTVPELVLVRLYSSHVDISPRIYLICISVNVTSISVRTKVMEENQCRDIREISSGIHCY